MEDLNRLNGRDADIFHSFVERDMYKNQRKGGVPTGVALMELAFVTENEKETCFGEGISPEVASIIEGLQRTARLPQNPVWISQLKEIKNRLSYIPAKPVEGVTAGSKVLQDAMVAVDIPLAKPNRVHCQMVQNDFRHHMQKEITQTKNKMKKEFRSLTRTIYILVRDAETTLSKAQSVICGDAKHKLGSLWDELQAVVRPLKDQVVFLQEKVRLLREDVLEKGKINRKQMVRQLTTGRVAEAKKEILILCGMLEDLLERAWKKAHTLHPRHQSLLKKIQSGLRRCLSSSPNHRAGVCGY